MKKKNLALVLLVSLNLLVISCKKEVNITTAPANEILKDSTTGNISNSAAVSENSQNLLPANAQSFLKTHFPEVTTMTISEKTIPIIGKSFEAKLGNGFEIDFNEAGEWHEIDGNSQPIPAVIIPSSINEYLLQNYKDIQVTAIDKENKQIKVELTNNMDLLFDNNGKFLKID